MGRADWSLFIEACVSGTCGVLFLGFFSWVLGLLVFSPFYEPTMLFRANSRFRISDILVLGIHLQIVFATMLALAGSAPLLLQVPAVGAPCLLVAFWWLTGVRMLARSGVEATGHRWLFLGVLLPLGYVCGLGAAAALFVVPFGLIALINSLADGQTAPIVASSSSLLGCALAVFGVAVVRGGGRWIAESARLQRAQRDGVDFVTSASGDESVTSSVPPTSQPARPAESLLRAEIADCDELQSGAIRWEPISADESSVESTADEPAIQFEDERPSP